MIPKIIHYCWFGSNPLPESAKRCIESWRKYLPDYEIKEWNETNIDVNLIPYTAQAYAAKKYAFVSDYIRFKVLYEFGGIYFDTDVEVIKPFDRIIEDGSFMGFEENPSLKNGNAFKGNVNPGLGMGAISGLGLFEEVIKKYNNMYFINEDGSLNQKTVVEYTTKILVKHGLTNVQGIQHIAGVNIYPAEYFNPLNDNTGRLNITKNTYSVHWYSKSWINEHPLRRKLSRLSHRILGTKLVPSIKRWVKSFF